MLSREGGIDVDANIMILFPFRQTLGYSIVRHVVLPGVFDEEFRDEVFALLGDVVELVGVEVPLGECDVRESLLLRLSHKGR